MSFAEIHDNRSQNRVESAGVFVRKKGTAQDKEREVCDFCGTSFSTIVTAMPDGQLARMLRRGRKNTKYCSEKCRDTATRRRSSARLGIRARAVSKFSSPLYFS